MMTKHIRFLPMETVLKQKTTNSYLLYIFVLTIVSAHVHGFPLDLSPVVLLKLIICFLSQVLT